MQEFDKMAFTQAPKKNKTDEINILKYIMTGASWAASKLYENCKESDDKCSLCGETEEDITHILWHSKKIHIEGVCEKMNRIDFKVSPSACCTVSLG